MHGEFGAILLSGGKSTRMGEDKSFVLYNGKMLGEWSKLCLMSVSNRIIVSSNTPEHAQFGHQLVSDKKGEGPLAGIYAGLLLSENDWNYVLACDLPHISPQILLRLSTETEDFDAVVAVAPNGKVHPLTACYNKSVIPYIEKQLEEKKYAVMQLLDKVKTNYVQFDDAAPFVNINHKKDVK